VGESPLDQVEPLQAGLEVPDRLLDEQLRGRARAGRGRRLYIAVIYRHVDAFAVADACRRGVR
jgi:hypothetical protein